MTPKTLCSYLLTQGHGGTGEIVNGRCVDCGRAQALYIVRLWDGFDGEWMDVSEPLPRDEADKLCAEKNVARIGPGAGSPIGGYHHIDYYRVFPADTRMVFSDGYSQTRGGDRDDA